MLRIGQPFFFKGVRRSTEELGDRAPSFFLILGQFIILTVWTRPSESSSISHPLIKKMAKVYTAEALALYAVRLEQRRINRSLRNRTKTRLLHALFPFALRKGSHEQTNTLDDYKREPTLESVGGACSAVSEGLPQGTPSPRDTGPRIHLKQE